MRSDAVYIGMVGKQDCSGQQVTEPFPALTTVDFKDLGTGREFGITVEQEDLGGRTMWLASVAVES